MIISHAHKFIFFKSTKTAGTSIEMALAKFCGPDDIITPLWDSEETIKREKGYRTAQNYALPFAEHRLIDQLRILCRQTQPCFYNHIQARDVKPYLTPTQWQGYYKFAVARNPWDRVMSQYHFSFRGGRKGKPLDEFLSPRKLRHIDKRGWGLYSINNEVVVNKVCRFENLHADLEEARLAIGLPEPLDLPQAKTSFRKDKPGYQAELNDDQRDLIGRIFRQEIEYLGYRF